MREIDLRIEVLHAAKRPAGAPPNAAVAGPSVSRAGDLWRLGPHELLCGGASERSEDSRIATRSCAAGRPIPGATARHGVSGASFDEMAQLRAAEAASSRRERVPDDLAAGAKCGRRSCA